MQSDQINRLLAEAPLPASAEARERAVLAARATVAEPVGRSPVPRRLAIAAVILALLTAASLTPPGRAVAERIAELIGIGGEPSGSPGFGSPATVIGIGDSPQGFPYEVIAAKPGKETCVGLDLPGLSGVRVAGCVTADPGTSLEKTILQPAIYSAPREIGGDAELVVQGLARDDVESVEVTYFSGEGGRARAPIQLARLNRALASRIGSQEQLGFFAGFLPTGVLRGEPGSPRTLTQESVEASLAGVEIVARDEAGEVLLSGSAAELVRALRIRNASPLLVDPPPGFESAVGAPPGGVPDAP